MADLTIGIDLSAQPERTAAVLVEWSPAGGGRVPDGGVSHPLADEEIIALLEANPHARAGIDAPFGWPVRFRRALDGWENDGRWPGDAETRRLRFRETDLFVRDVVGWYPLSVSTDRIGVAAFRCVRLLAAVAGTDGISRVGGRVMEVYPAAALAQWAGGMPHRRYKGSDEAARAQRGRILRDLTRRARLELTDAVRERCLAVDHCLDGLICALIARAGALDGGTVQPVGRREVLDREGWIEIPTPDSLDALAAPP